MMITIRTTLFALLLSVIWSAGASAEVNTRSISARDNLNTSAETCSPSRADGAATDTKTDCAAPPVTVAEDALVLAVETNTDMVSTLVPTR